MNKGAGTGAEGPEAGSGHFNLGAVVSFVLPSLKIT